MKKHRIIYIALVLSHSIIAAWAEPSFQAVDAEPLGAVPKDGLVLHSGWQLKDAEPETAGSAVSKVGYEAKGWFETTVPTTVLGALVRHGVYPDPYIGTNNMLIPDASDEHNKRYDLAQYSHLPDKANPWTKPWWFRREFTVPANFAGRTVWLNLDGINYRADVWINGRQVASSKDMVGMFRRFRFNISKFLEPQGSNALAICIHQLDFPGDPAVEQLGGLHFGFGPNGGDAEILHNVTQYSSIGWDWVPAVRDRNIGLWQNVWLEASGAVAVRDPSAFTDVKLPEGKEAAITVRGHLQNAGSEPKEVQLHVRIEPDGFEGTPITISKTVLVPAGEPVEFVLKPQDYPELIMKNPRLWWPVTYGDHPLYRLTVEALEGGNSSSKVTSHFGVRTVGSIILPSGGRAFTINGRTLRMTGGAWINDFLLSWGAQRYRDEVRLMAEGNHTVVRVNGCGIVPPEVFYDACDRNGLLVWQDLSRTSVSKTHRKDKITTWHPPSCDAGIYLDNMTDSILRLRGHSSILLWCGSNEAVAQEDIGKALQNEILPALDGTRTWLVSSSGSAPWGKEKTSVSTGGPWHMVRLPEYYRLYAENPGYTARNEIGLPSVPPLNSIAPYIPDLMEPDPKTPPFNRTTGYHDATGNHFNSLTNILRADMGPPANMTELLKIGDLYNDVCYRAIFEAANKARPRNAGTHLWKVNAAWPSYMWQVFDWSLRPNAGYYSMRSACKPLHVQASFDDFNVQVVSTLATPRPGLQVRITVAGLDGSIEAQETRPADVPADATLKLGALPAVVRDGKTHIVALDLCDEKGTQLDRTVIWAQDQHSWKDLFKLPPAAVKAEVVNQTQRGNETVFRIQVTNTSKIPAIQVWVELLRGQMGEEILPAFWSDNALTMMPGEMREVTVSFRSSLLGNAEPHLALGGWNVTPHETAVEGGKSTPMSVAVSGAHMQPDQTLSFTAKQVSAPSTRYHTWTVPVWMDGQLLRYIHVGLRGGEKVKVTCSLLPVPEGKHTFAVGDAKILVDDWPLEDTKKNDSNTTRD